MEMSTNMVVETIKHLEYKIDINLRLAEDNWRQADVYYQKMNFDAAAHYDTIGLIHASAARNLCVELQNLARSRPNNARLPEPETINSIELFLDIERGE